MKFFKKVHKKYSFKYNLNNYFFFSQNWCIFYVSVCLFKFTYRPLALIDKKVFFEDFGDDVL